MLYLTYYKRNLKQTQYQYFTISYLLPQNDKYNNGYVRTTYHFAPPMGCKRSKE